MILSHDELLARAVFGIARTVPELTVDDLVAMLPKLLETLAPMVAAQDIVACMIEAAHGPLN